MSEVHVALEDLGGLEVGPLAVDGVLDAVAEPVAQVHEEDESVVHDALTDEEDGNELGVSVNGSPGPYVAVAERALAFLRDKAEART